MTEKLVIPAHFLQLFEALGEPALALARVIHANAGFAQVRLGAEEIGVLGPGSSPLSPISGDWVAVDRRRGVITHVLPRRTAFVRQAAGKAVAPQTLVANMDLVFLLMALDADFSPRRLERYLTLTHASGAVPIVLLTKAALRNDCSDEIASTKKIAGDVPVHAIDVLAGIEAHRPREYLSAGVTAALLGSSGVGKSTLINHLLGAPCAATHEVRVRDGKGRHTTTRRELFVLHDGAFVIDTPGMRELQLWADTEDVEATFPEILELAQLCRFRDCQHSDEPGCAVLDALERGDVDPARVQSYRGLLDEVRVHQERQKNRRRARARVQTRALRDIQRRKYGKPS
jgi:ribosome biogenesis GTPase